MSGSLKNKRPNEMRLKSLNPNNGFPSEIVHNFERINPFTGERESDLPVLNFDGLPYTPAVLSGLSRDVAEILPERFKEDFYARIDMDEEEEDIKKQLLLPKPNKGGGFCGICENVYNDYLTHMTSNEHNHKLKSDSNVFYLDLLMQETQKIQDEFQNHLLNEVNFDEITPQETFAVNDNSISEKEPINDLENGVGYDKSANKENDEPGTSDKKKERTARRLNKIFYDEEEEDSDDLEKEGGYDKSANKENDEPGTSDKKKERTVRGLNQMFHDEEDSDDLEKEGGYDKSANKENDEPGTSDKKKNRTVRRLNQMFYEDPKEITSTNTGRQNPVMGRKIQVQKVFDVPTASQRVLSGEDDQPSFEEENNLLRNWMFNPQENMKNSPNDGLVTSNDAEQREKGSSSELKRNYSSFAGKSDKEDQEVLNDLKKVKITDDTNVQEDEKMAQAPAKGTLKNLVSAFSEGLGNLKVRLSNQFGIKK